ncbi:hypothetical protein SVAN01_06389 [Stagonosporopsis vannaccii]|nr:hypothetical protein SVAN01_06389 [Stagonosporopsis vannaccii]
MHAKNETQSPRLKPAMFVFSNLLHPSTHSTVLGDRHNTTTQPIQSDLKAEHQHAHQFDHHQIAAFLVSFLSHMFAPAGYQQCTLSASCCTASHRREDLSRLRDETAIIVDDELVLLENRSSEEQDGGPICREATIESWKAPKKARRRYLDARQWTDLPYFGCP